MPPRRPALACILVLLCALAPYASAASAATPGPEVLQWRSGLTEINEGWATHAGDDLRWAQSGFDDSAWPQVDLEDMGPAQTGWRWFRKRVNLGADHAPVHLLLSGGDGTYEIYINGRRMEGAALHSQLKVTRPIERVFPLENTQSYFIAIRTRTPVNYARLHLPLFLSVTLGNPVAISYERESLQSQRLYGVAPTVAVNLLLCLAGLGAFGLFAYQRTHRDYLFLGLFLLLTGLSDGLIVCQGFGVVPTSINFLFADPLTYLFTIAQIEFTFAFAAQRITRVWRAYEILLIGPLLLAFAGWFGLIPHATYELIEALVTLPAALALPILLFVWWRRGNREAGLLILPTTLPITTGIITNLGSAAIVLHWDSLQFLADEIPVGPFLLAAFDLGTFLFLLSIAVVIFFRFNSVSREQARTAAELNAAREIQQRLVPASLPGVPGFTIQTSYLPAQEVGGDFYQVLTQQDCSTLIVVGDVSGKGLKAAMTGALAIGAIRTLSTDCLPPAVFLARLNQQLVSSQETGFVTCLCARIVPGGSITFANAGHLAPYWNGAEVPLDSGLPLGITSATEYTESTLQLATGDTLTLLSDGVLEARNASGELFGFDRTRAISHHAAAEIASRAEAFGQEDDITVLTLRFAPAPVPS
ncbi:hypothetical protein DYQ86_21065 [Acidobacteria bacterium AB60]|nr:hypothetical protein DYQ86_21065 [Acidobacteria bacterium AB60]